MKFKAAKQEKMSKYKKSYFYKLKGKYGKLPYWSLLDTLSELAMKYTPLEIEEIIQNGLKTKDDVE